MITQDRLKEVIFYDPESGIFKWKAITSNRVKVGDIAGRDNGNGYIRISIDGRGYYAHRLAWLYIHGELPKKGIDHKDGDGKNNKIENLRPASQAQNGQNQKLRTTNVSGHTGVSRHNIPGKWIATIWKNNKKFHIGVFDSVSEANTAYLAEKARLHTFQPIPRES